MLIFPDFYVGKTMKLSLLSFLLFLVFNTLGQDTIVHRNGSVFIVELIKESEHQIVYKLWDQGNSRTFKLDKKSIFSIRKKKQDPEIVYHYNPEIGNKCQVDEMRLFIKGEQDAQEFSSPVSNTLSIIGGAAGGYVLGQGGILGITAPMVVPVLINIFPPGIKKKTVRDNRFSSIEAYRAGYLREARKKRYFKSLILSSIAMGVSTAVTALVID